MEYDAAKCPSCGAAIQVSLELDLSTCQYCGTSITPREAVDRALDPGLASKAANLVVRARQSLEAHDFREAFRQFTEALDCKATDEAAWQGCLLAVSRNLTKIDYAWAPFTGAAGIPSIVRNYLRCTPRSRRREAAALVRRMADLLRADLRLQTEMRGASQRRAGFSFLLAFGFAIASALTLLALALPFTAAFGAAAALLAIRGAVVASRGNRAAAMLTPYPTDQLKGFLAQVEAVLPPAPLPQS